MHKRLWHILGPIFCAHLLVVVVVLFFPNSYRSTIEEEKKDAVALSSISFKSRHKKNRALSNPEHRFVPFFGSSEWLRFDSMHPSVLASAYQRSYTPYLLGQRGASSLTQYFGMQQMRSHLKDSQAIYIISPQWFSRRGEGSDAFEQYFSSDQAISFLQTNVGDDYEQYAAKRFLELKSSCSLTHMLQKVANKEKLTDFDRLQLQWQGYFLDRQDALFSRFPDTGSNLELVKSKAAKLPKTFSYDRLVDVANSEGRRATQSNDFQIDDTFYKNRLKSRIQKFKHSQTKLSYLQSPEYNDLQLVLNEFAKHRTNVLFVIPPVNGRWMNYTGLNKDMYQATVAKIKHQLTSQGFNHIADLSEQGNVDYFMQDTIHIGWRGWLELDRYINPFLTEKQPPVHYHINKAFLTPEWAKYKGKVEQFLK
ncbi:MULTISPECIES: D-alanyl-lipoteichoic acid biosynthesis protein DltD [Streptococcus]|uniref:D-alanyl-lipoteichoic acid biosynthesis protein DltD n=1 Tax=Streptococcus TaxID=1301 RepID=UPI0012DF5943|nr:MULTISPECIES: D-alanyl-lipoteichoic acid biosynthesis protein DltD [Streptococcus]QHF55026.1 D-alanyl-lipoteichoic acid biosynthesis protein DltD [Streptococcus sp. DAT741]BDD40477.1 D-alanyl transfer protein DltD [Streptococcus ruminantium]BDD42972.1 D-alanyl transfer protein DltD [Streptococcus ruminantium]